MAFVPSLSRLPRPTSSRARTAARPLWRPAPSVVQRARMSTGAERSASSGVAESESFESAWKSLTKKMQDTNEIPPISEWHRVLDVSVRNKELPSKGIWLLDLMRDVGLKPNAASYERLLQLCAIHEDRTASLHLVEHMFNDKVLLGDVEFPDGMEKTLRAILPPDAFE